MSWTRFCVFVWLCSVARTQIIPGKSRANDGEYNTVNKDGSFDFGYANTDQGASYHLAHGNANQVVGGRFGSRDPASGNIKETVYTAGPRGFRAKGPNIHRMMDLDQRPRGPIGNKDDPYFDPNEDPSYSFKFNTRTYSKNENADSRGDVKGYYTFIDDTGERHDVSYIAGKDTGFHVSSSHPDAPNLIGAPFHRAPLVRGETKSRGRTAVQRGLDGSYRFISAGPDQRRTESSDSHGNVRGSYSFLDDKGVQRTVHYIAGPGIGYRIVKNSNDPSIPSFFPTIPSAFDPSFVTAGSSGFSPSDTASDDVFKSPEGTAASGHVKPQPFPIEKDASNSKPNTNTLDPNADPEVEVTGGSGFQGPNLGQGDTNYDEEATFVGEAKPTAATGKPRRPSKPYRPAKKPFVTIKPFVTPGSGDDDFEAQKIDKKTPEFGIGFNIKHTKPGTTIIRNIGKDYIGVPPGVSVRAHVQSIDLYPYDSKRLSPSEALEKDKI